jgi:di/tricarboxylate transporter
VTRYRFGRIVAWIAGALGLVLSLVAIIALVVVMGEVRSDRAALSMVVPIGGVLATGLALTVLSCAARAVFDLADRALSA